MKIRQNARHFASRKALETPVVRSVAVSGLVRLHTSVFLKKADPDHAAERKDHLDAFFEATMDTYLEALRAGYTEAEAREITHIQANFDFYNHGWTEMMEFPADELEEHYDRYCDFFESWDVTIADPLGAFEPEGGIPEASSTPKKLDDPVHPYAEGGFADDVYVEGPDGEMIVGGFEMDDDEIDVTEAVGVDDETIDDVR